MCICHFYAVGEVENLEIDEERKNFLKKVEVVSFGVVHCMSFLERHTSVVREKARFLLIQGFASDKNPEHLFAI